MAYTAKTEKINPRVRSADMEMPSKVETLVIVVVAVYNCLSYFKAMSLQIRLAEGRGVIARVCNSDGVAL